MKIAIFWFRRDLRLLDNTALNAALESGKKVIPVYGVTNILDDLEHRGIDENQHIEQLMIN